MFNEKTKTLTIPEGIVVINQNFWNFFIEIDKSEIENVIIPDSVVRIENWAFADCKSLTSISIPKSVTSIGHCAFNGCENLTSINIPNSVKTIGHDAFANCRSLKSIEISNEITSFELYSKWNCSSNEILQYWGIENPNIEIKFHNPKKDLER